MYQKKTKCSACQWKDDIWAIYMEDYYWVGELGLNCLTQGEQKVGHFF